MNTAFTLTTFFCALILAGCGDTNAGGDTGAGGDARTGNDTSAGSDASTGDDASGDVRATNDIGTDGGVTPASDAAKIAIALASVLREAFYGFDLSPPGHDCTLLGGGTFAAVPATATATSYRYTYSCALYTGIVDIDFGSEASHVGGFGWVVRTITHTNIRETLGDTTDVVNSMVQTCDKGSVGTELNRDFHCRWSVPSVTGLDGRTYAFRDGKYEGFDHTGVVVDPELGDISASSQVLQFGACSGGIPERGLITFTTPEMTGTVVYPEGCTDIEVTIESETTNLTWADII